MNRNVNKIKWLKLNKEDGDLFLCVELYRKNKTYTLSLKIDSYTYNKFLEVFKQVPFKDKHNAESYNYNYWFGGYSTNKSEDIYYHIVIINLGKKRYNYKCYCSKFFCQNIKWLLEVENENELSQYLIDK